MSTAEKYAIPTDVTATWDVPANCSARFSWEYDEGRDRLLSLYQKGKDKQWDSTKRIDWSIEVDPGNPVGMPEAYNPFLGHRRLGQDEPEGAATASPTTRRHGRGASSCTASRAR